MTALYRAVQGGTHVPPTQVASADGAITITDGRVAITKGSAAALTLAAPTSGVDDFKTLIIFATTAHAHTVTVSGGVNGAGASGDVGTFGGARGDAMHLIAYGGVWYTVALRNVTLA